MVIELTIEGILWGIVDLFMLVGNAAISISDKIPYEYVAVGIVGFFLIIGIVVSLPGPKPIKIDASWERYDPEWEEAKRIVEGEYDFYHARNKAFKAPVPFVPQRTARIVCQFKPVISQADSGLMRELNDKKNNLIEKKEAYLQHGSLEDYQKMIEDYDTKINQIYHENMLNSTIESIQNPIVQSNTATGTTAKQMPKTRRFVQDAEYKRYIHSDIWAKRSRNYRESVNGTCENCHSQVGVSKLTTHHIEYVYDLEVNDHERYWLALCRKCHQEYKKSEGNRS